MNEHATAHELLSHALKTHIENARKAALRVVSSGVGRRAGAKVSVATADADDAEAVHDFRVALRRLRTGLKPARKIYGEKQMRSIEEGLKRFADVTSALRDEEVLRETLTSLKLSKTARAAVDTWIARRARQERARRTEVVKLLREVAAPPGEDGKGPALPTLAECLERLEKRLDAPKRGTSAVDLGHRAIKKVRESLPALDEVNTTDGTAMHTLRIQFKRLRYTAELFKPALGEAAGRTASAASKLQSCLGSLHDFDEAMVRMARAWGLAAQPRSAVLEALRSARAQMAERCKKELAAGKAALMGEGEVAAP